MHNPVDWGVGRYERTAEKLFPAAHVLVDSASLRPGERVLDLDHLLKVLTKHNEDPQASAARAVTP